MAIPADSTRVVFVGHLGSSEQFNVSFWLTGAAPISDASASDEANIHATDFASSTLDTAMASLLSADCGVDKIQVYGYVSGGSRATSVGQKVLTTPVVGTGSGNHAFQIALVATTLTANSGRRTRGRMYFPACGISPATHVAPTAVVDALSLGLSDFFTKTNANPAIGRVAVVSSTSTSAARITTIRVDNKIDIQRRRANKQGSNYAKVTTVS